MYDDLSERSVLGCIFFENKCISEIKEEGITADSFYDRKHKILFSKIEEVLEERSELDFPCLYEKIIKLQSVEVMAFKEKDRTLTDSIREYVYQLIEGQASSANAAYYARNVKKREMARLAQMKLQEHANRLKIYDSHMEIDRYILAILDDLKDLSYKPEGIPYIEKVFKQGLYDLQNKESQKNLCSTGFKDLDRKIRGFEQGRLYIVAARPGVGKTALALKFFRKAVVDKKVAVFFSLEMLHSEICHRLFSIESRIPYSKFPLGNLHGDEMMRLNSSISKLKLDTSAIYEVHDFCIDQLRNKVNLVKMDQDRIDLIIVDYIQIMEKSKYRKEFNSNREQIVAQISRGLKNIAKELKVPVIALSQLNRSIESRQDRSPQLSDLRESGAIEQDADVVMMLERNPDSDADNTREGKLHIKKNRAGEQGVVSLSWIPEYVTYEQMAYENQYESYSGRPYSYDDF